HRAGALAEKLAHRGILGAAWSAPVSLAQYQRATAGNGSAARCGLLEHQSSRVNGIRAKPSPDHHRAWPGGKALQVLRSVRLLKDDGRHIGNVFSSSE